MGATNPPIMNRESNSGRFLKEDSTFVNFADTLLTILDAHNAIKVSTELQAAIHDGDAYSFSSFGTMLSLSSLVVLGRVGAKQVHFDGMMADFQAGGIRIEFIEAPTVSAVGTLKTARRKNRAIDNPATTSIYTGSTITGGEVIFEYQPPVVAGQGNSISSATSGIVAGWVLNANTDYVIRFTNTNALSVTYSLHQIQ